MRRIVGIHGGRRNVRMLCMNGGPDTGPRRWTFTYGLECGHETQRVHKKTTGRHLIGDRLKCETCSPAGGDHAACMSNDFNLARHASGLRGFCWMPRMRATCNQSVPCTLVAPVDGGWWAVLAFDPPELAAIGTRPLLPDLDDPATLGCFEHELVPKAWGPTTRVSLDVDPTADGGWAAEIRVWDSNLDSEEWTAEFRARTRTVAAAMALVAALEAAPRE
jgi:hypothetical protein